MLGSSVVYLVRHGQTEWNVERRWQGVTDIPLNARGRAQAAAVARAFSASGMFGGAGMRRVVSSDLSRAKETAEEIARVAGVPLETTPRLRERSFGRWEGLSRTEIAQKFPGDIEAYETQRETFRPLGGQSWRDFSEQSAKTVHELVGGLAGQSTVVVAHAGPLQAFLSQVMGTRDSRPGRFVIDNGSVSVVREWLNEHTGDRHWVVTALNITCHLHALES